VQRQRTSRTSTVTSQQQAMGVSTTVSLSQEERQTMELADLLPFPDDDFDQWLGNVPEEDISRSAYSSLFQNCNMQGATVNVTVNINKK
jgi:hypothetical protein